MSGKIKCWFFKNIIYIRFRERFKREKMVAGGGTMASAPPPAIGGNGGCTSVSANTSNLPGTTNMPATPQGTNEGGPTRTTRSNENRRVSVLIKPNLSLLREVRPEFETLKIASPAESYNVEFIRKKIFTRSILFVISRVGQSSFLTNRISYALRRAQTCSFRGGI